MRYHNTSGMIAASMAAMLGAPSAIAAQEPRAVVRRARATDIIYVRYATAPRSPNGGHGGKHRSNRQHQRMAAKKRNKA